MTKPIARDPIYRRRVFDADIIQLCVRWYITYRLSYRDLVELMAERGVPVAHSTILRWVTRYVPEFERRWNRFSRPVGTSWRVDETCIAIRAKWHYLYRAVDKQGKLVDFLLRPDRGIPAAQAFFRKAAFASGSSLSGMGVSGAACRSNVCGIWRSRRAKGMAPECLAGPMPPDAPEPILFGRGKKADVATTLNFLPFSERYQ